MIKWIYILLFLISTTAVITCGWRNANKVKRYKCSNNFIKLFYGISFWIVNICPGHIVKESSHVEEIIKKLSVKEQVTKEHKEYVLEKTATVVLIVYGALLLATVVAFVNDNSKYTDVLQRYDKGQGEAIYELNAIVENETRKIEVVVQEKTYSEDEAMELLKVCKNSIQKEVLADNKSPDRVDKSLNLVESMLNGEVQVQWEISNDKAVGYDGKIGEVKSDGTPVELTATLVLQGYTAVKNITLTVFPIDPKEHIQEYVQMNIDNSDLSKKEVKLPQKLGDKDVRFISKKDKTYELIFPVAVVAALFIYFFKDRELQKELDKRNLQMMADYPEIVSKLLLLTMTGMSVRRAFVTIADGAEDKKQRYVYGEIRLLVSNLQSGRSELKAYEEFGKRCGVYSYIRLMNIISQNLKRGSNEMGKALKAELDMALLEKKNNAIKIGETAGTKLMVPMILLLIISLVIIAAPALLSLQMR
ncbi:MAG: hypothetical protein IKN54_00565 [Lachnospiraceae bacterium]|nr:hypothetical protein [Lachnospiraceae bacterium]